MEEKCSEQLQSAQVVAQKQQQVETEKKIKWTTWIRRRFVSMLSFRQTEARVHSIALSLTRAIASGIHPVLALIILSKWTQLVVSSGHEQQMHQQQQQQPQQGQHRVHMQHRVHRVGEY